MKCSNVDQLIRFYYDDMNAGELLKIKKHLGVCSHCIKRLDEIKAVLTRIDTKTVTVSPDEINTLIDDVKNEVQRQSLWQTLKENVNDACDTIRLGLSYKPQLVPIVAVFILALAIIPFKGREAALLNQEFDILQLQMEVSLDMAEMSLFELYQDDALLLDDFSRKGSRFNHV